MTTEDYGSEKSSGSMSESESSGSSGSSAVSSGSSGDGPPWPPDGGGSSSSSSSSDSSAVECICDVGVAYVRTNDAGGGAYVVDFVVSAGGTCDVTIVEFSSTYGGLYDFTSVPQQILGGLDGGFIYSRDGEPAGDVITVRYICENGHEDTVSFTIP